MLKSLNKELNFVIENLYFANFENVIAPSDSYRIIKQNVLLCKRLLQVSNKNQAFKKEN
jgi:hypothetical protein